MTELLTSGLIMILRADGGIAGTGLLISRDTAVTCTHVLAPAGSPVPEEAFIRFYGITAPHKVVIDAKYCRPAGAEDIAFLTLIPPVTDKTPLPLGSSSGTNGHEFDTFGFPPINADGGVRGDGHVLGKAFINKIPVLQIDSKQVTPGFSGAPVLDKLTGRVIGMVTKIAVPDEYGRLLDVAFITPSESLRAVLPALRIEDACPYRGLSSFTSDPEDVKFFWGRERLTSDLVTQLSKNPNFLAVVGPSGSGKSSVVNAGLVPAIRAGQAGFIPERVLVFSLSKVSLDGVLAAANEINSAATNGSDTRRIVFVLDELEQFFVESSKARDSVIPLLAKLVKGRPGFTLLTAFRSDFYDPVFTSPLGPCLDGGQVNVRLMSLDELKSAIATPAASVGLRFSEGLVDDIAADAAKLDNPLPLLEFTLTQLWERRNDGEFTRDAYRQMNGVAGSIAFWASDAFARLSEEERRTAQRILLRLIHYGDGNTPDTRKRAPLADLVSGSQDQVQVLSVVMKLATSRILITDRDPSTKRQTVGLIHDALITQWEQLAGWIKERRQFLEWRQRLGTRMEEWDESGIDDSGLLRGYALNDAVRWLNEHREDLSEAELRFVGASIERQSRLENEKREEERRQLKRTRRFAIIVSVVSLLALAATVFAAFNLKLRHEGQERQSISLAEGNHHLSQLAATGENHDAVAALNLAVTALYAAPVAYSRNVIFTEHARATALSAPLETIQLGGPVGQAALSPNGQIVLLQAPWGAPTLWDIRRLIKLPAPQLPQGWTREEPIFSPSGNRVAAVVHVDGNTQLWTWELATPRDARQIALRNSWSCVQNCEIAFPDEQHLVVTSDTTELGWQLDNYALSGHSEPVHIESGQFYASGLGARIKVSRIGQRDLALITPYTGFHQIPGGGRDRKTADILEAVDISTGQIVYERRVRSFIDAAWLPGKPTVILENSDTGPNNAWLLVDLATGETTTPRQGGCDRCSFGVVNSKRLLVIADDKLSSVPLDNNNREPLDSRFDFNRTTDGEFNLRGRALNHWWLTDDGNLAVALDTSGQLFSRQFSDGLESQRGVGKNMVFATFNESERSVTTVDRNGALRLWSLEPSACLWSEERVFSLEDVAGEDLANPMFVSLRSGWLGQSAAAMLVRNRDNSGTHLLLSRRNAKPSIWINLPFDIPISRTSLYANRKGEQFAVASDHGGYLIISSDGQLQARSDLGGRIEQLAFAGFNDEDLAVSLVQATDTTQKARLLRLDLSSAKIARECEGPSNKFFGGFTNDSRYALYYDDSELTLWSTETCRPETILKNFARYGSGADWGSGIAAALMTHSTVSVTSDSTVRLDLGGKATWVLRDAGGAVSTIADKRVLFPTLSGSPWSWSRLLAIDPGGDWLAAGTEVPRGRRSRFAVFDTETGLPIIDFGEFFPPILASTLESDGKGFSVLLGDGRLLTTQLGNSGGKSESFWIKEYSKLSTGLDPSSGTPREVTLAEIPALRVNVCKEITQSRDSVAQAVGARLADVHICAAAERGHSGDSRAPTGQAPGN
jgi:hypothetical protein